MFFYAKLSIFSDFLSQVCKFSMASNRDYKSEGVRQKEVGYFYVKVRARMTEDWEKLLKKDRGAGSSRIDGSMTRGSAITK